MISHVKMALANLEHGQKSLRRSKPDSQAKSGVGSIITAALTLIPQAIIRTKKNRQTHYWSGSPCSTSKDLLASLRRDELDF